MTNFIRCPEGTLQQSGVFLFCRTDQGAMALTEEEVIDQYATSSVPRLDQEDFVILGTFATFSFAIAYGVKILRNSLGDK